MDGLHRERRRQYMSENQAIDMNEMMNALPSGLLRIAMDDELTIIHATDTFYKLLDMDQSKAKLPKSIFKTVYSADIIFYTQQIATQKRKNDNHFLLFYRILQKSGNLKWIMISGNKTDQVYKKQDKNLPIYFCMALDASDHMIGYRNMDKELDYHRTILEISRELFFEYVIASDTLSFSELFRELFGKESVIKGFSKRLEKTKMVHPDDLPGTIKAYKSMMSGKKQARMEFRMTTKEGDIVWHVCYASIIYDENKNPYKVVGKLSRINTDRGIGIKKAPEISLDSLTQVYTKKTAENIILDNLSTQGEESISALFVCEVGNYKGVNDVIRMVEGENVLSSIAGILKSQFRASDVIGRMGLGNFIVYMKDIRSDTSVYQNAEYICKEVNKLYSYDFKKNGISINIGIALVKGQADFSTAMANAKTALVMSKKESTSSFEIFYP